MLRKTLNASRLQDEVKRRLQRLQEVVEDGVKIVVPRPQIQAADRTGCNWTMKHFGNAAGFEASIAGVLAQVQKEYNLAEGDEAADATEAEETPRRAEADPFGGAGATNARVNPFGDTARSTKANPFGDATPAKSGGDPFGAPPDSDDDANEPPRKRPANPFGD